MSPTQQPHSDSDSESETPVDIAPATPAKPKAPVSQERLDNLARGRATVLANRKAKAELRAKEQAQAELLKAAEFKKRQLAADKGVEKASRKLSKVVKAAAVPASKPKKARKPVVASDSDSSDSSSSDSDSEVATKRSSNKRLVKKFAKLEKKVAKLRLKAKEPVVVIRPPSPEPAPKPPKVRKAPARSAEAKQVAQQIKRSSLFDY